MAFNFEVKAIATLTGYVEADSEKEAIQRIKDMNVDYKAFMKMKKQEKSCLKLMI